MTLATDLRQLWSTSADPPDLLSRFDGGTPVQADQEARFPDLAGLWCQLVEWPEPMDSEVLTNRILQRFRELRSEGGRLPRIEFSLAGLPTDLRPAAFQMMLDEEFSGLRDRGLPIDVESWLHRFPRYASRIEEVVSGLSDELRNDRTCVTQAESILQRTQPVRLSPEADQTAMVIPTAAIIADDPIPDFIAGYRIERVLGRGGCGRVLLGTEPETGTPVALKQIRRRATAVVWQSRRTD